MKRVGMIVIMSCLMTAHAWAATIKAGTATVEGGVNIGGKIENYKKADHKDANTYAFRIAMGLFVTDNVELGFELEGMTKDYEEVDVDDITEWSFIPYGLLHIPVSDDANLFVGGGVGFLGTRNTTLDPSGVKIMGRAGLEYFFTPQIALTFNFRISWLDVDYEFQTDDGVETINDTVTTFDNVIGIKLFF